MTTVTNYYMRSVRCKYSVSTKTLAKIYADAAAWLEGNPGYDAHVAIGKATDHISDRLARTAQMEFSDSFGYWPGNDEGVTMLCLAAAFYEQADPQDMGDIR